MTAMTCAEAREHAAELALGVLTGGERARLLEHLATCASCRSHVAMLTHTVDLLHLAGPQAEPPPGFEERVLRAVDREGRARPRRRWLAAAAAAMVLAAGGGVLAGRELAPEPTAASRDPVRSWSGPLLDHERQPVGTAVVRGGEQPSVFVAVDGWGTSGRYPVELVLTGRRRVQVFTVDLVDGRGVAAGPVSVPLADVRAVWVVDDDDPDSWCAFRL